MRREIRWAATAILATALLAPPPVAAKRYKVDANHTTVGFKVRHLFSRINGRFRTFTGQIVFDPTKPEASRVEGSVDAASIDTDVEKRDKHLRGRDFFYVEKYPKITFSTDKVTDVDLKAMTGKLHGKLTIRGVTRPVVLDVSFFGEGKDPWGNTRAGFHAETKINRKDFGLKWNEALETGGVLVGEEVTITIDAEGLPVEKAAN